MYQLREGAGEVHSCPCPWNVWYTVLDLFVRMTKTPVPDIRPHSSRQGYIIMYVLDVGTPCSFRWQGVP